MLVSETYNNTIEPSPMLSKDSSHSPVRLHQRRKTHHHHHHHHVDGSGVLCDITNTISTITSTSTSTRTTEWYYNNKVNEARKHDDINAAAYDDEEMVDMDIDSSATTSTTSSSYDHNDPKEFEEEEEEEEMMMMMMQQEKEADMNCIINNNGSSNSSNEEEEEEQQQQQHHLQQQHDYFFHHPTSTMTSSSTITYQDPFALTEETLAREFLLHLRSKERLYHIGYDYFDGINIQPHLNAKMRAVLVDWLIEVHHRFKLQTETLYLTLNYVDRFLAKVPIERHQLQLIGATALFLASKFEEVYPVEVDDLAYIGDRAYTSQQILVCEKQMLTVLEFNLMAPTVWSFISHTIKCFSSTQQQEDHEEIERIANMYAHYAVLDFALCHQYQPSKLAASCLFLAFVAREEQKIQKLTKKERLSAIQVRVDPDVLWTSNLTNELTGFDSIDLISCVRELCQVLSNALSFSSSGKLIAIQTKFNSKKYGRIAKHTAMPPVQMIQWLEQFT